MAEANVSATNQDGLIKVIDGSGNAYLFDLEPGDFSWQEGKNAPVVNLTRGKVAPLMGGAPDMRASDQGPCTGSFTIRFRAAFSTTEATAMDLVSWQVGDTTNYVAENWVSTHPFSDEQVVTLEYWISGTYRGVADQKLIFPYCALRQAGGQEANPTTLKIEFTAGCVKPTRE